MKLSDYVLSRVAAQGVRCVFLVPGGAAMHLNDSLAGTPGLSFVATLHEQAAAIAAEAYAQATFGLGVVMVTAGPGGTNAVTGVAGAWVDSTPVLFLSGQVKRADLKTGTGLRQLGVQEVDIVSIVSPITKYAVTVTSPATIRWHIDKAMHLALNGRPGPVWLDIPLDVQAAQIDPDALVGFVPDSVALPADLDARVEEVISILEGAERPVLLVGKGVRLSGGSEALPALAEALGVPVLVTWCAVDLMGWDHPLFAGRPGSLAARGANFTLQNCDALIVVGARLDRVITAYSHENLARAARKVVVDIDPAELAKISTAIEVPLCLDAKVFLDRLAMRWGRRAALPCGPWRDRVAEWKRRYPVVTDAHRANSGLVSVYAFADALSEHLREGEAFVIGSSGIATEIFHHAFRFKRAQRILHNDALGSMGYALPMAVGGAVATGAARMIALDGDGGCQFNIQELQTVRRHSLPVKLFVLDNDGYSAIRTSQRSYFGRLVCADASSGMSLPELKRLAEAWLLPFYEITDQASMKEQIKRVLDAPGPAICRVVVIPEEERAPRISSKTRADGSMVSSPLEDLYPFLPREEFYANMIAPPLDSEDRLMLP